MHIVLKPSARFVRVSTCRYSPPQDAFLRCKTEEILRLGLIRRDLKSQWASAPSLLPKEKPEQLGFTADLRRVNSQREMFN